MIILIPPSEGKEKIKSNNILFGDTDFKFKKEVKQIIRLLDLIDNEGLTSIYGTSQDKSEAFHRQNQDVLNSRCAHAIERYTGVVYEHINWETLSKESREYMEKHVRIFSGFFGMLTPLTMIPNYKLKMNVLLLHKYWNPKITDQLKNEDVIIDLLPQVHRKAYVSDNRTIKIDFFHIKSGKKVNAGHFGKAVKGQLIRYIIKNKIIKLDDLSNFNYNGYKWDGSCIIKE